MPRSGCLLYGVQVSESQMLARALVTENVPDFRRLEADALARDEARATLVFTSNRQFPRGEPGTTGRLVEALHALVTEPPSHCGSLFLKRPRT